MDSAGLGALGFWIFVAVIVVALIWSGARQKAEKHETLRRIVEKTGTIDEEKLNELFAAPPSVEQKPGSGYRALRIGGTIVMFIGAAVFTFFSLVAGLVVLLGEAPPAAASTSPPAEAIAPLFAVGIVIALVGYGLFFASRFAEPPADVRNEPPEP
jgi:hypothetical protein